MAGRSVATCYGQRNYCTRKVFSNTGGSASSQYCSPLKVGGCYNLISLLITVLVVINSIPDWMSQNFMTSISSAFQGFFLPKFKKCNQISIKFCYVVKGMLKLLCGWFMNWLHLLPYFLPHKLSVATKNIRRGKVLLVKQQVKGSYPHGIELLFILGTSLSTG